MATAALFGVDRGCRLRLGVQLDLLYCAIREILHQWRQLLSSMLTEDASFVQDGSWITRVVLFEKYCIDGSNGSPSCWHKTQAPFKSIAGSPVLLRLRTAGALFPSSRKTLAT